MILGSAGLSMLIAGTVLAVRAEHHVEHIAQMEMAGGALIVGGLSLIGIGLAWALNSMAFVSP